MRERLHEQLTQLRLRGIERALDGELDRAEREGSPLAEVIGRLLAEEEAHRREKSLDYRLTQAKLPWDWTLESFPFDRQPGVDRAQIRSLAGLDFLRERTRISFWSVSPARARPESPLPWYAWPASTATRAASTTHRNCSTSSTLRLPTARRLNCSLSSRACNRF